MPKSRPILPPVAELFALPPETIAQRVTDEWHAEHPEWTADDLRFTHIFLLEVYRQAAAWWARHPRATHEHIRTLYDEIVKTNLRGERFVPMPGVPFHDHGPQERQKLNDALWNGFTPAEKARFEYRLWRWLQRGLGLGAKSRQKRDMFEYLLRRHRRERRSPARSQTTS